MTEDQLRAAMEHHGPSVYRLALCRLQHTADAEDVYQEVFLRYFRRGDPAWDGEHTKAWLLRVTVNRCADVGRRRLRWGCLPLEELTASSVPAQSEQAAELWAAVGRLKPNFRTVVHLHYAEGYSTEEIAALLSIPAATVRTRLHRGRETLKTLLGGDDDE